MSTKRVFRSVFESTDMMRQLIQCVIVPNCMATVEVIDQFEEQPHLYIKNYEEVRAWRRSHHQGYKMSSQRYAVAHLITSLREQYKDQFVAPLMAAISTLLAGSPEQRDCAYHLFFYRCTEFPTIMRPARLLDDADSVKSFLTGIVLPDLAVRLRVGNDA